MNRESIIINSIEKNLIRYDIVGKEEPLYNLKGVTTCFEYKNISASITISTDTMITEEEIKDKIIEVLG